jgi:hypothetical protein
MSKGGGGGGTSTTVQKADPWVGLQGPLTNLYAGAQNWYGSGGPQYYPGQTVAPQNAAIQNALAMGNAQALAPQSPLINSGANALYTSMTGPSFNDNPAFGAMNDTAHGGQVGTNPAQGYFQGETNGNFLTNQTNPYLNGVYNAAARPVVDQFKNAIAPAMASQFSAAGRTGSGAAANAFGQASQSLGNTLGDLSSNLFGNAYNAERQLQQAGATNLAGINESERAQQLAAQQGVTSQYQQNQNLGQQAALAAPQFAQGVQNLGFNNANALMGIGQYQQAYDQDLINAAMNRWNYNQQLPLTNLQSLNQLLQGGMALNGTQGTQSTSMNRNPFAGVAGGAMLGQAFNNAGAGLGLGGLLGGALLGGLFG